MITGHGDVHMAVRAMRAGAVDFLEKPVTTTELLAAIARTTERVKTPINRSQDQLLEAMHLAGLTARQREILQLVLAGHPTKNIAADLGISQRTVENHRMAIMRRTGSKTISALVRRALVRA